MKADIKYKFSRDYKKLLELISDGFIAAAFVDYSFRDSDYVFRDICKVERKSEFDIYIGVRGTGYGGLYDFYREYGTELEVFEKHCKSLNLEWIEP